jgi:hypothetical protein
MRIIEQQTTVSFNSTLKKKITSYRTRSQPGTNLWYCKGIFIQFDALHRSAPPTEEKLTFLISRPPVS